MSKVSGNLSPADLTAEVSAFKPLSRNDVASIQGVSVRTVENWRREKRIPPSVEIGGRVYWHPDVFYAGLDATLRGTGAKTDDSTPAFNKPARSANRATASSGALDKSKKRSAAAIAAMMNRYQQLRPHAALLHKAALHEVPGQPVASSFVARYRFAPCGFTQQALCKVAYAGAGLSAAGATRSLARPTHRRLSPWWCAGTWSLVRRFARVFWLVACGHTSCVCPAHPGASHASRALARRGLPVRPQGGALSPAQTG